MAKRIGVPVSEGRVLETLNDLFRKLLGEKGVDLILAPQVLPGSTIVQQTLVRDPKKLESADPLAPILPVNSATLVARLTRGGKGGRLAAVMRPCEIRAFVELVKLNQGSFEGLVIIGIDCLGTFDIDGFNKYSLTEGGGSLGFYRKVVVDGDFEKGDISLRSSCRGCVEFIPNGADLRIVLLGTDIEKGFLIETGSQLGEEVIEKLDLDEVEEPSERSEVVSRVLARREAFRKKMLAETDEGILGLDNLSKELSLCINCHNCREVCPLCYCKQCVFESSTFEHDPLQYIRWAERKGAIKMPTDTLFYHLTRMAHMSTSCVGCGQCSSACPMGIRVAEIFSTVASRTQKLFDYVPGRDSEESLPIATFKEEELT